MRPGRPVPARPTVAGVTALIRLGIDFGTSHTVAVLAVGDQPPRPLIFDGSPLLPSAVCVDQTGRLAVGRDALHLAQAHPERFEPYPKRCIDDGVVLLGQDEIAVQRLIGAVIGQVAFEAARVADAPVTEAVVTCPAAWAAARRAVLLAAVAPALPTARLELEPVAAAHRFASVAGGRIPVDAHALVYDLGAGTFDASVLRRTDTGFTVVASGGLADLGGLDVDAAIVSHLGAAVAEPDTTGWSRLLDPTTPTDRRAAGRLWDNVRTGKEMLARTATTTIHIPLIEADVPLGREELDEIVAPLLARTVDSAQAVLAGVGLGFGDLAAVFLTGGATRMPAVATAVHRAVGRPPVTIDQPELAVAEGSLAVPRQQTATPGAALAAADGVGTAAGGRRRLSRRRVVGAVGTGLILIVSAAAGAVGLIARGDGSPAANPSGTADPSLSAVAGEPSASPSPSYPPGVDPCLLGSWQRTGSERTGEFGGRKVVFVGGTGVVLTFDADGRSQAVFSPDPPGVAVADGVRWEESFDGRITSRYFADGSELLYSNSISEGTYKYTRNGRLDNDGPLVAGVSPETYRCTEDRLVQVGPFYTFEHVRVSP